MCYVQAFCKLYDQEKLQFLFDNHKNNIAQIDRDLPAWWNGAGKGSIYDHALLEVYWKKQK